MVSLTDVFSRLNTKVFLSFLSGVKLFCDNVLD